MDDTKNVGGRDRLGRFLLAALLSTAAVRWLRSGKRLRGLLAGVGALGFGFTATTRYCGVNDALDIDTTDDSGEVSIDFDESDDEAGGTATDADETVDAAATTDAGATQAREHYLTCAACGEPIVAGQSRGPNEDDEIVHDDCA
ncbi:YgaP-like transmembrane domain [Haloarcula sediminis]|uniref:YgaP-like transmembrane domain n=1 Tax=Haloarcula sediminis TaxID=3111777 RepID=UPI002D767A8B|nr:YgaP-like transmembrane domain [Haloarcula sp. CK38]